MTARLNEDYDWVRKNLFPRWDSEIRWTCVVDYYGDDRGCYGYCNTNEKKIIIAPDVLRESREERLMILAHEIAHGTRRGHGHGKVWQSKMNQAARRARMTGEDGLADALEKEVTFYVAQKSTPAAAVYGEVEDYLEQHPNASYEQVLDAVSRRNGLTPKEFEQQYRRTRRVYNAERKLIASMNPQ